jgi:hypothetical protein
MRWNFVFDRTYREVLSRETDLRKSQFNIPKRKLVRIGLWSLPLLLVAMVAYHFEQYVPMGMAIFAAGFYALWQILFYGFSTNPEEDERVIETTNYYSNGTLIFLAVFSAILIMGVSLVLYLKAHDS